MRARLKRWQTWVAALAVLGVVAGGWNWWRSRAAASSRHTPYRIVEVRRGSIEVTVQGTGTVSAVNRKELRPGVSGTVSRVAVREGDRVTAGQLLVELSSEDVALKLDGARLELDQARRELEELVARRDSLVVRAPFRGRVTSLSVTQGQRVSENSPIATLTDDTRMLVEARFTQAQIGNIQVGQAASVFLPDFTCTLPGRVTAVNRLGVAGGSGSVLYPVTVEVDNPGGLSPGQLAQVEVRTAAGPVPAVQSSTLSSPRPVEVRAAAPGTVTRVAVSEGSRVEAGQVLAVLAGEDLEDQIEAQNLKVQQAQLEVSSLEEQVASTRVVAPFDGTVVELAVAEGDEVTANTVVAVVASYDRLQVVVGVDELDISSVSVGQQAVITTEALAGQTFRGTVADVAQEGRTEGGVGVFDVTVEVADPGQLRAGMTAEVRIQVASRENALLVPVEAVQQRGDRYFVWVVGAAGEAGRGAGAGATEGEGSPAGAAAEGRAGSGASPGGAPSGLPEGTRAVPVEVGLVNSTMAEITSGLREGDRVLVVYSSAGQEGGARTRAFFMEPGGPPGAAPGRQRNTIRTR